MSRTSIVAILATVGVVFTGEVTTEAMAFARAVQTEDEAMFNRFVKQYPNSQYRSAAEQLAFACKTNWVGGACGLYDSGSKVGDGSSQGSPIGSGGTLGSGYTL